MVALVLSGLDILLGLLLGVAARSLLLLQLLDKLLLVADLILKSPDLVVLAGLVLLSSLNGGLQISDGVSQSIGIRNNLGTWKKKDEL